MSRSGDVLEVSSVDLDAEERPEGFAKLLASWDTFWFTPSRPHTLCVLRILTGAMLLYCHLVLATDLESFLGESAWINNEMARQLHDGAFGISDWARSYLWHIESAWQLRLHHGLVIAVTFMFLIGLATRITAPLTVFFQLMIIHRLTGAVFGLDQIATYTAMYLSITPCGSRFSVDAIWRSRKESKGPLNTFWRFLLPDDSPTVLATVGTRMLQIHLCVIYLFGGLSKGRGVTWWDGTAVWYAVSNYEYQSWDMTWLSRFPAVISALSNFTLFWEVFYCALIWNRYSRPLVLLIAVGLHGSIGLFIGMMTFGLMMIIANGIFLPPRLFQSRQQREMDRDHAMGFAMSEESFDDAIDDEDSSRLDRKKEKLRSVAKRVKNRYRALKEREEKYEARVKKLREREARIKVFAKKRRQRRGDDDVEMSEDE